MAYPLTAEQIAVGDAVAPKLEKMWGWYLAGGILSVLFGFAVISAPVVSLVSLAVLASCFFIAIGVFQLIGSASLAKHRWMYLAMGVLWIGAGVIGIAWPGITLFVVTILIGWSFLLFGLTDLMHALHNHHLPHWWYNLIRGIASLVIAFLALTDPGGTLGVLVTLLGIYAIFFGVIEIVGSFSARHATRHWGALKSELG
jgi:uncharacterized membrane protein HdeD (DUF308 family)